ncbi:PQQ-binding-like beta-propeller repeat protein [Candidatus Aenigmatarchaeota archaeon]
MKKCFLLSIIILFLFVGVANAQLADSAWPMLMGNVQHTGVSPYDTSHVDGTIKWKFDAGSAIYSSPVIGEDGTIYVGTQNSDMYAVNPDGTEKWVFDAGEPVESEAYPGNFHGIISTPAIDSSGVIYFTSLANYLFAVNPDGTEKWKFPVKRSDSIWCSPTIDDDGTIYIGSYIYEKGSSDEVGYLFAVNPDGTEKWKFETTHVHPSTAIGINGELYVGGATPIKDGNVVGLINTLNRDGDLVWNYAFETWQESSPSVADNGMVYIGSKEGKVYAINPDGTLEWTYEVEVVDNLDDIPEDQRGYVDLYHLNGISAVPAIGKDGTIYVGAWNSYFYAFNPDGTLEWKFETPPAYEGVSSSAAIGADGTIYFGSNSGYFYALNPDGTEKWKFKGPLIGGIIGSPAIGTDGTVYIGSNSDGHLYAFGGPDEEIIDEAQPEEETNEPQLYDTTPESNLPPNEQPVGAFDEQTTEKEIPIMYVLAVVVIVLVIGVIVGLKFKK